MTSPGSILGLSFFATKKVGLRRPDGAAGTWKSWIGGGNWKI
jgi:hypothetical protein